MPVRYLFRGSIRAVLAWALVALLGVGSVSAADPAPPALDLPIACAVGTDCWVVNYVDLDPSVETRDYACGKATYDGHKGVDFAIRDLAAMAKGVPVLAAAPGTVEGVRDGMADLDAGRPGGREAIAGALLGLLMMLSIRFTSWSMESFSNGKLRFSGDGTIDDGDEQEIDILMFCCMETNYVNMK